MVCYNSLASLYTIYSWKPSYYIDQTAVYVYLLSITNNTIYMNHNLLNTYLNMFDEFSH